MLAAEVHLVGQLSLEEQTLTVENVSDMLTRNSKTNSPQKWRTEFRTKTNLNKKECSKVIPDNTNK
jgi:hypothetical protein